MSSIRPLRTSRRRRVPSAPRAGSASAVAAAVGAGGGAGADGPGDTGTRGLLGQFRQGQQRVGGRVTGTDDEGAPAGEPVAVRAEHVGQGVLDPNAAASASPWAGMPEAPRTFGVRQVPDASMTARASIVLAGGEADQERGLVRGRRYGPGPSPAGSRPDLGAVADVAASAGSAARGCRYSATSSPPVGSTSGSGSTQPVVGEQTCRAAESML